MKLSVRQGVFETNSSSIHACVILPEDDYNRWKDDNLYVQSSNENNHMKFTVVTKNEVESRFLDEYLSEISDSSRDNYDRIDFEDWIKWDKNLTRYKDPKYGDDYYDSDIMTFIIPSGDIMVAANYYGYDG